MLGINHGVVENVMTWLDKVSTTIDADTPETAQVKDSKIHPSKVSVFYVDSHLNFDRTFGTSR
jgi:hypothetical protein